MYMEDLQANRLCSRCIMAVRVSFSSRVAICIDLIPTTKFRRGSCIT